MHGGDVVGFVDNKWQEFWTRAKFELSKEEKNNLDT